MAKTLSVYEWMKIFWINSELSIAAKKKKDLADPSKALLQICSPVYKSRGTLAMVSQLCKIGELQLRRTKDMAINQTRGSMTTLLT